MEVPDFIIDQGSSDSDNDIQVRPKIKLSLFPQTRPTRENRPDSINFFAIFFEELFFRIFRYNRYWFVVLRKIVIWTLSLLQFL